MLKTLIVDDVQSDRESLRILIGKYLPQINLVGMAEGVEEAVQMIRITQPDLVFLDVEMPGGTGFDLLRQTRGFDFAVIFVTAYNDYAVRAFKVSAIDYLLKPINIDELILAVQKAERLNRSSFHDRVSVLQEYLEKKPGDDSFRMAITTPGGLHFIYMADLIRLEADGKYTRCVVRGEKNFLSSKNLGEIEKILNPDGFFRVHHSHLINLKCIATYSKEDQVVFMMNGDTVAISQRRRAEFLRKFQII